MHPCHSWFAHSLASLSRHLRSRRFYQAGRLDSCEGRQVPRAPLPNSGVTFVGEMCTISWESITSPSSLVRAHAPLPLSSLLLRFLASFGESLQVVTSPCCPRQLPDVSSENLFLDAGPHTPAVLRVLAPVSSTAPSAFPMSRVGSASRVCPRMTTSRGVAFRGCRYFVMFRPPSLLAPQIVPTAANTAAGQPGLLRPGTSCFVTSARSGYANRPNTGNWRYGDLHPARFPALSAASLDHAYVSNPRHVERSARISRLYAHLPASPQGLWDLSCRGDFRLQPLNLVAVE